MSKTEEILDKVAKNTMIQWDIEKFKKQYPTLLKTIKASMVGFAQEMCEEQKQVVFNEMKHIKFGTYGAKKDVILNAPTPKMD
jgi:hypothetical protein